MLEIPILNIKLYQGDDDKLNLTFRYADASEVDFTKIKRIDMEGKVGKKQVFSLSSTRGEIKVVPDDIKQIEIMIPASLTETAKWTKCDYDIQVIEEDQGIRTICKGVICLEQDVTYIPNVKCKIYSGSTII